MVSSEDAFALALFDRQRLTRHRRLVHRGMAQEHHAVNGNARTLTHHHEIAWPQGSHGHLLLSPFALDPRGSGHQGNQFPDRVARAARRQSLQEVCQTDEEHDEGCRNKLADGGSRQDAQAHDQVSIDLP